MKRAWGVASLAAMALVVALAFFGPAPAALAVLALGLALVPRGGRRRLALFAAGTISVNALIVGLATRSWQGALEGAIGGARLAAALAGNLAILERVGGARLLDSLRLPPRVTILLAAVLLAAQDAARDLARLVDARRAEGAWPRGRIGRVRASARLFPALFVLAEERARARRDAAQLAGFAAPAWFVPLVAVSALAVGGRLALVALPNVALTYVVIFLGGLLYGAWVGVGAAFLSMTLTDVLLSGLYPLSFVNAPAMALLALGGAALRRVDLVGGSRVDRAAGATFAFAIGMLGTFAFSVATDSLTALVVAPGSRAAWAAIVLAGLAFNVLPALANGLIFALSVRPVLAAHQALQEEAARAATARATRDAAALPPQGCPVAIHSPEAPPPGSPFPPTTR